MSIDKKKIFYGLVAVIVLQTTVLLMEYVNSVYPLVTGTEIKIKVIPVDPRSLFRGNYARLNYDISRVNFSDSTRFPRNNETVYVTLKLNDEGLYEEVTASLSKPESGIFIRGRMKGTEGETIGIRYGIEAFFAPKEKALDLEKKLRSGGIAVVMLAENGKPALKDIIAH